MFINEVLMWYYSIIILPAIEEKYELKDSTIDTGSLVGPFVVFKEVNSEEFLLLFVTVLIIFQVVLALL